MRRFIVLILFLALALAGCGLRLSKLNPSQKAERLALERGKLSELVNPVAITRSQIVISQILLDFLRDAIRDVDTEAVNAILPQYSTAIRGARDAMVNSDIDPIRRPAGYKDLELALREQTRVLRDLSTNVGINERAPLTEALEEAASIRTKMLEMLFPQGSKLT